MLWNHCAKTPIELESRSLGVIELPPENVGRWTASRKAAVVRAVNAGEVTHEEICRRYQLSVEELLAWQRDYESHGPPGLRSTRLQVYHHRSVR
jgi:transposase-like protein